MWKMSDIIFCQSESLTNYFIEKYKNINAYTLLNPSRENNSQNVNFLKFKKYNKKDVTFSYLGNIGKAQSIELFLNSFESIKEKNFTINMCGDGSSLEYFKKKYNNSNVIWHGWIENIKLINVIQETDIFILSLNSYGRQSLIVPSKLQTYFKYSKPILCLASGASSDLIIKTNTGIICNDLRKEKIIQSIESMLDLDQEIYDKMSKNCYNYYLKMLSPEKIADDFIKLI